MVKSLAEFVARSTIAQKAADICNIYINWLSSNDVFPGGTPGLSDLDQYFVRSDVVCMVPSCVSWTLRWDKEFEDFICKEHSEYFDDARKAMHPVLHFIERGKTPPWPVA